jgi:hypothetical protein
MQKEKKKKKKGKAGEGLSGAWHSAPGPSAGQDALLETNTGMR